MNQKKTIISMMMKAIMGVYAVLLCVQFTTLGVLAYTRTTGTVVPATAKIRAEANTSSEVVGSTAAGKTVSIVDEATGSDGNIWYQIEVDGNTKGYIRSDLVTKSASSDLSANTSSNASADKSAASGATNTSLTQVDSQAATVSTASANVRKSASTTAEVISSISKGTSVTITGETTGDDGKRWFQITYNGTSSGFVRADLVTAGAAETEVVGTKNTDTSTGKQDSSPEAETQETSTEEGNDSADTEMSNQEESNQEEQETTQGSVGAVTILTTEETPALPSGFQEVSVTLNNENVRAWKNGDFYIFYGQSADGSVGFFMYDSVEKTYQRYFMSNIDMPEEKETSALSDFLKPVTIGMAAVLLIFLIIIVILTIKINEYKEELSWDSEEEDEYPEEEIEEEEEELPRQYRKKKKKVRPVFEEEEEEEEEEPEQVTRRVRKKKVDTSKPQLKRAPQSKPRNFLQEEELEYPVKKKIKKKPAFTPISDDLDPDDEDTFVFINLDGEDLD